MLLHLTKAEYIPDLDNLSGDLSERSFLVSSGDLDLDLYLSSLSDLRRGSPRSNLPSLSFLDLSYLLSSRYLSSRYLSSLPYRRSPSLLSSLRSSRWSSHLSFLLSSLLSSLLSYLSRLLSRALKKTEEQIMGIVRRVNVSELIILLYLLNE